ncbi:MAG: glycosyltransferase family 9 protein [Kiritimatiellia bacterium]
MKLSLPANPRILIIRMSSLGDLFHALPVARELKRQLGATIDWVTQPEYAELVECFSDVDRVIVFPRKKFVQSAWWFVKSLRRNRYDAVIDLQGLGKSVLAARLARSRVRIGPSYHREGARFFYTHVAGRKNKNRHAVDEALDAVRYLGLEPAASEFPVKFPELPLEGTRRVVMVPCSRWDTKNWPPEKFIELGLKLSAARPDITLFLAGSPADTAACERIEQGLGGRVVNLCGKTSLVGLGSVLRSASLVITVDSGPMHMAAAIGTPVLAVFGATDPVRTGPYGDKNRVVTYEGKLDCRPCLARTCRRGDLRCLAALDADRVLAAALEMLGS